MAYLSRRMGHRLHSEGGGPVTTVPLFSGGVKAADHADLYGHVGMRLAGSQSRAWRLAYTENALTIARVCVCTPNQQAIAATYFGVDSSTAPAAGEGGAIGDTKIAITADVTGIAENEFNGGWLTITTATGLGQQYLVKYCPASPASGKYACIEIYDGLAVALDNSSVGILQANLYYNVNLAQQADFGEDQNQFAVGVANVAVAGSTDAAFFWLQTWGPCAMVSGAAVQKHGCKLTIGEDVDGVVQKAVSGEDEMQILGYALADTTDTLAFPAFATFAP